MRGRRAKKRLIIPDAVHKSRVVTRTINVVMEEGKKSIAQNIVYDAIEKLSEDPKEALKVFEEAIKNIMPQQEVRSRRVGGATYQVPMPLKHDRSEALAIRWVVGAAKSKSGKPMADRLYDELKNAHQGIGDSIKKKEDTHKMAEANRAFAHFARY
ncbi:MAG: 30S ribosomal protein S7 [Patescibacteria group bacterium]|nr:30S ribosomal protein S7 [Patescibacteria group bacterium]